MPRYSHTAVARNLVKRRLRDLIRTELLPALAARAEAAGEKEPTPGSLDVVIRAAPSAYKADFDTLRTAVRQALQKLPLTMPSPANPEESA